MYGFSKLIFTRPVSILARSAFGFVAGVVLLFTQGCGGPPLKPWHTKKLNSEFTVHKAEEVRTFDDYRKLEDELFSELEAKVYGHTGTGRDYALVRYSAGSAADPQVREPNWNRSFELRAERPIGGVLLLHGMSDSPYSLRALGEVLNQRGYWVLGLRLPGHGTAPSGLRSVSWRDMAGAVRLATEHLVSKAGPDSIHMVGYSTGAGLALDFALDALEGTASPVPASLVLISPAIGVHPAAALASFKDGLSVLPGMQRLAYLSIMAEFDPYKYNSFATNAGDQVHRITRSVSGRIAARSRSDPGKNFPPTLVFKSTVDATVSTEAVVDRLLKLLEPNRHELVLFDINRFAVRSTLVVSDPAPLTDRLMNEETLPFTVTFVSNANPESTTVVAYRKPPFSGSPSRTEPLDLAWPRDVVSLSHIALPFPPEDPLYGRFPPEDKETLFLGQMAIQGERGLLKLPDNWLMRLRYNPFYKYLERRAVEWLDRAGGGS